MFILDNSFWEIRDTKNKGKGVFVKKDILPGTVIGDYIGKVIRNADDDTEEKDDLLYLMYYNDRTSIFPDLTKPGIHLLNNSCTPNCWMYTYKGHTLFFALRHILPGEELTISYLIGYDASCLPCTHICKCGTSVCTGTFHLSKEKYEKWNDFHTAEAKKTKPKRITYGNTLPLLDSYPKTFPDEAIYNLYGSIAHPPVSIVQDKLPAVNKLRKIIRETGRTILLPNQNLHIYGIVDDRIVTT